MTLVGYTLPKVILLLVARKSLRILLISLYFVFLDLETSKIQLQVMSFVGTQFGNHHTLLHGLMELT